MGEPYGFYAERTEGGGYDDTLVREVDRLEADNERLRAVLTDAAYLARLARGSSWPGEMAERVERAAERVIRAAANGRSAD